MIAAAAIIIFSAGWLARSIAQRRGVARQDLGPVVLRRSRPWWISQQ